MWHFGPPFKYPQRPKKTLLGALEVFSSRLGQNSQLYNSLWHFARVDVFGLSWINCSWNYPCLAQFLEMDHSVWQYPHWPTLGFIGWWLIKAGSTKRGSSGLSPCQEQPMVCWCWCCTKSSHVAMWAVLCLAVVVVYQEQPLVVWFGQEGSPLTRAHPQQHYCYQWQHFNSEVHF